LKRGEARGSRGRASAACKGGVNNQPGGKKKKKKKGPLEGETGGKTKLASETDIVEKGPFPKGKGGHLSQRGRPGYPQKKVRRTPLRNWEEWKTGNFPSSGKIGFAGSPGREKTGSSAHRKKEGPRAGKKKKRAAKKVGREKRGEGQDRNCRVGGLKGKEGPQEEAVEKGGQGRRKRSRNLKKRERDRGELEGRETSQERLRKTWNWARDRREEGENIFESGRVVPEKKK